MRDKLMAWHFLSADWKAHGGFKVEVGKTYTHTGPLVPCKQGLHASVRAVDAAYFNKGPVVTRVECDGPVKYHDDGCLGGKLVCASRTAIWGYDATDELRAFACWCALQVVHLWRRPMPEVVRRYLETGDETIRAKARATAAAATAATAATADDTAATAAATAAYAAAYADDTAATAAAYAADAAAAATAATAYAADAADAKRKEFYSNANERLEELLTAGAKKRGLI